MFDFVVVQQLKGHGFLYLWPFLLYWFSVSYVQECKKLLKKVLVFFFIPEIPCIIVRQ